MSWVTVDRAKAARALASTDPSLLATMIPVAESYVEEHLHRKVESASYTEYQDGDGSRELILNHHPITTLTSVTLIDWVDSSGNEIITLTDLLTTKWDRGIIAFKPGFAGYFPRSIQNIEAVYVGGYLVVPAALIEATVQTMIWLISSGDQSEGITKEKLGDYEIELGNSGDNVLPPSVTRLLSPYVDHSRLVKAAK